MASELLVQEEGKVDPAFEFEAPKYIDFETHVENNSEDAWFGMITHIH